MRQKKSYLVYYIAAAVLAALVGAVIFTEVPVKVEHVEEIVE